jgi:polyhydroxyalkanoate synthesis regulator phasin
MASKNPNIKHIEVQGIKLDVDIARFNDQRFTYIVGKVTSLEKQLKTLDDSDEKKLAVGRELLMLYAQMMDLLFDDNAYNVMNQLADGGSLTPERWSDFVADVMNAANAKN